MDYYKEKLSNLREIARGVTILLITLLSGNSYLFIKILLNGFKAVEFALLAVGYILSILIFLFLIKLYRYIFEVTEKIKELK
jgi:hypothetical protein